MSDPHASAQVNRNLLLGILAYQVDFISRTELIAATQHWAKDKSTPLDDVLIDQGVLKPNVRDLLLPLVAQHIDDHDGDPEKSLAALSGIGSVAAELRALGDRYIDATVSHLTEDRNQNTLDPTMELGGSGVDTEGYANSNREPASERFRILRSHAKGGLGEVYVAKDTELNREVAVKEIQTKYADDHSSRLRFLLEAEVTGGLEHPGIVPVYGLGRYEDGRPFYAMRFIKGDSLQEAANRFHKTASSSSDIDFNSVDFRKLLGRFIDVCQAIEYAHSRGVLHRDLKPGNIMLGKYGETLVVDWGLAKAQGRNDDQQRAEETILQPASASGSAPTVMGSAVGTPAFMPPEQAAGDLDRVGPQSDVYSLGATLYYLLVGRAPFSADNLPQLLQRVQDGDFSSPRELRSQVPKPLEAICLRAMSRSVEDRYVSTQELAEEVERFLADEPVTAFAEPLSLRARRWIRTHQTLSSATAAVVLVSVVGLSIFSSVVSGKNTELRNLNVSLDQKNLELGATNAALSTAIEKETKARELAQTNEQEARAQSQLALATLTSVIGDIQEGLENLPGGGEVRRLLLETSLSKLDDVATQYVEQSTVDRQTMSALSQMAQMVLDFGGIQFEDSRTQVTPDDTSPDVSSSVTLAMKFHQRAREIAEQLAAEDPEDPQSQRSLVVMYNKLGNMNVQLSRLNTAMDWYQQSQAIIIKLVDRHPENVEFLRDLAISHQKLGDIHRETQNVNETLSARQECVRIFSSLVEIAPDNPVFQSDLSASYVNLGDAQMKLRRLPESLDSYQKALKISRERYEDDPNNTRVQNNLSIAFDRVGDVQGQTGQPNAAVTSYQESLRIQKRRVQADPNNSTAQFALLSAYSKLGSLLRQLRNADSALIVLQDGLEIAKNLTSKDPQNPQAQRALAIIYDSIGASQNELGKFTTALATYQSGKLVWKTLVTSNPDNYQAQTELADACYHIGELNLQLGDSDEALKSYEEGLRIRQELASKRPESKEAQLGLATSHQKLGFVQLQLQDADAALESYQKCLKIRQTQSVKHPDDTEIQSALASSYVDLAGFQRAAASWIKR